MKIKQKQKANKQTQTMNENGWYNAHKKILMKILIIIIQRKKKTKKQKMVFKCNFFYLAKYFT